MIIAAKKLIRDQFVLLPKVGTPMTELGMLPFFTFFIMAFCHLAYGAVDKTVYIGEEIEFKNTTKGPADMTWSWDFGDKSPKSDKKTPTHFYKEPGEYTVKLTVQIPNVDAKEIPEGKPITIKVLPVEATIKSDKNPGKIDGLIKINVGDEITFGSDIKGPNKGPKIIITWDFGDDSRGSSVSQPKHRFSKASPDGEPFEVRLGLKIPNIDKMVFSKNILKVEVAGMAPPPPLTGKVYIGQDIQFKNPNPSGPRYKYIWKFDESKEGHTVTHRYLTPGKKRYTLEMYIDGDFTSTGDAFIEVHDIKVNPSANGKNELEVKAGEEVEFTANTEGPPGMTWSWDFGGGASTSALQNPKITFEKPAEKSPLKVSLKVKVPNIEKEIVADPILVTIIPQYNQPSIKKISLDTAEIGADGNYTAKIIVDTNGTFDELKLEITGDPITDFKLEPVQLVGDNAKAGKHAFTFTLGTPTPSVSRKPVTENLTVTATIFPDDPEDEKKDEGYAKTETLSLTVIPQKPAWLLYAKILAGCILLAIIVTLVILAKRPVIPGQITLNGTDHYLTSSPLGPKKGKLEIDLGNLDSEFDGFIMTISAEKRSNSTQLRINSVINSKNGAEGEVVANGDYYEFGRGFPCVETMNIGWSSEERGRLNLTYDTHQSDSYDYGESQDDETYEY